MFLKAQYMDSKRNGEQCKHRDGHLTNTIFLLYFADYTVSTQTGTCKKTEKKKEDRASECTMQQ